MSFKLNDEDKEVREFQESLPFGVSVVQVTGALAGQNDNGKDYIEVGVVNEAGIEDAVKLWFTGGASNISFNTLRAVAVHCAGDDEKAKEDARQKVDAVADGDELAQIISEICTGKKIWYSKYYDAKGRTFTNEHGTFKSVNRNIHAYEPKARPDLMPKPADENGDAVTDAFPGAENITNEAASTVPKDDDWSK